MRTFLKSFLILSSAAILPLFIFAAETHFSSPSFTIENPVINSTGEFSSSSNFGLHGNIPWIEPADLTAASFQLLPDFLGFLEEDEDEDDDDDDQGGIGGGSAPPEDIPSIRDAILSLLDDLKGGLASLARSLIPDFLRPYLPDDRPIVVDDLFKLVPRFPQIVFRDRWELIDPVPLVELVLAPLPDDIRQLAQEIPSVGKLFNSIAIDRFQHLTRLRGSSLTLPGITKLLDIATVKLEGGSLVPIKDFSRIDLTGAKLEERGGIAQIRLRTGELVDLDGVAAVRLESGQLLETGELQEVDLLAQLNPETGLPRIRLETGAFADINTLTAVRLREGTVLELDELQSSGLGVQVDRRSGHVRIQLRSGEFIDLEEVSAVQLSSGDFVETSKLRNVDLRGAELVSGRDLRIEELTPDLKERFPSGVLFTQLGRGTIDVEPKLEITKSGSSERIISSITGKSITLSVKPEFPAQSVTGLLTFRSRQSRFGQESQEQPQAFRFISRAHAQTPRVKGLSDELTPISAGQDLDLQNILVVEEFDYHDYDQDGIYTAEIQAPVVSGEYELITLIESKDPALGTRSMSLITVIDPEGYVYERIEGREVRIAGSIVTLEWLDPNVKQYTRWPAEDFAQENPQITDQTGQYSFLVPQGWYRLNVSAPGYIVHEGKAFEVRAGHGVHLNIQLRSRLWYLEIIDIQTILLILVGLFLVYNFYRDKMRDRKERNAILDKLTRLEERESKENK
ncbi:MAG: carboxypeptidase-like regulatory domain-containing protein [Candidatus Harrisonbacteria bacterium]|nr:carboxypeptidase-like regulatory domain-containing protein [Candidatus Harrisonbacteria bacterium]